MYVNASLETCEARDPKGLYAMARRGELKDFCRKRRVAYHAADMGAPFDETMMELLRSGDFAR